MQRALKSNGNITQRIKTEIKRLYGHAIYKNVKPGEKKHICHNKTTVFPVLNRQKLMYSTVYDAQLQRYAYGCNFRDLVYGHILLKEEKNQVEEAEKRMKIESHKGRTILKCKIHTHKKRMFVYTVQFIRIRKLTKKDNGRKSNKLKVCFSHHTSYTIGHNLVVMLYTLNVQIKKVSHS